MTRRSACSGRRCSNARLGRDEKLGALQRLDEQSRRLERRAGGPRLEELVAGELDQSHRLGGRSVFGWEPPPGEAARPGTPRKPGRM